ncbi:hypothetical protein [Scytonema hofmannii]|nr:hypothetical protein [Scytonema hofmannii]
MSHQEDNNQELFSSPMDLLLNEDWLRKSVEFEDEVGGNISVGLDWGSALGELMFNPELFGRLITLRISLNREVRLLLSDWNLGTITSSATKTARALLLQKLKQPTPDMREKLTTVLQRDELFGEEFISNCEVLRELITQMLTIEDWETIATVAADSLKEQIMHHAPVEKISA